MIIFLRILFVLILAAMIGVTTWAGSQRNIFEAGGELLRNPWGVATLFDAYFGFLTFFVWVAYKERTMFARAAWFVLIMALGNIAMALYVLLQLFRMPASGSPASRSPASGSPVSGSMEQLLLRRNTT